MSHDEGIGTVSAAEKVAEPDILDPVQWSMTLKVVILMQVSCLAALSGMNVATINPALVPLSEDLKVPEVTASYSTTVAIALNGFWPFFWSPLANVYGRRPLYLFTTLIGFAAALGCSFSTSFAQLVVGRVFQSMFCAAFVLGPATVVDLFPYHQRGRAMGFFTVTTANGSHLAPIIGGLLGQYLGWRAIFRFCAIADAVMFVVMFFCLPETLYVTNKVSEDAKIATSQTANSGYLYQLRPWKTYSHLRLRPSHFFLPTIKMVKYPSVIFPALYYASQYGFASILPAVTVAGIWTEQYHWNVLRIGLTYALTLTIGGSLGELAAGMVVDYIVKQKQKQCRNGEEPAPECRLQAIWTGEILTPVGLLIYGFCIQYKTYWSGPIMGMGIAVFGVQIITTTCYTYAVECYNKQGAEVSQLINFCRQIIGMTFAFYAIKMGTAIGYQYTFPFFALAGGILAFLPMLSLMIWGQKWRTSL